MIKGEIEDLYNFDKYGWLIQKRIDTLEDGDRRDPKQSRIINYILYNQISKLMAKYITFPFMFIFFIMIFSISDVPLVTTIIYSVLAALVCHIIVYIVSPGLYTTILRFDEGLSTLWTQDLGELHLTGKEEYEVWTSDEFCYLIVKIPDFEKDYEIFPGMHMPLGLKPMYEAMVDELEKVTQDLKNPREIGAGLPIV